MWGRANMAAVILFLTLLLAHRVEVQGSSLRNADPNGAMGEAETEGTILERASGWLWSQRDKNAGWGNDTHRVLLVLRLSNLSRDENVAPPAPLEFQLSRKQMELEIVLLLWRHREVGFSPVRLASYTLALNAMCTDPRQFHGHDLIGTLQHHEPPTDYEFAFTTLAACNAQAHVRRRQIRRLLDIANAAEDHNVDTVAMVILALKCIVQDHRHRNLHHYVRIPSIGLAQQQRADGSFGNLRTTALAMQALEEAENEPVGNWNRSAALAWLASQQRPDGSFAGGVRSTAEALLGISPHGLATIRALDCGQGLADSSPPSARLVAVNESESRSAAANVAGSITGSAAASSTTASGAATDALGPPSTLPQDENISGNGSGGGSVLLEENENPNNPESPKSPQSPQIPQSLIPATGDAAETPSGTGETSSLAGSTTKPPGAGAGGRSRPRPTTPGAPFLVNVSYTLWVGSNVNETYNLTVTAPKNETFYGVMLIAAEKSPHFQFVASEWPNGHYVHTLAGYKEEPMSYHYWLLYRLPSPPEPSSPPGNQLVAPGGVDDLQISEGEHYLFWYKKL